MKTTKTFKVVMLPTENYSPIVHSTSKYGGLFKSEYYSPMKEMGDKYQHLYITSNDEIKDGDWVVEIGFNRVFQVEKESNLTNLKKIVATTDSSLFDEKMVRLGAINYVQLPRIPESFIRAYIKSYNDGKVITEVDLEMENTCDVKRGDCDCPEQHIDCQCSSFKIKTRPDNTAIVHQSKIYSKQQLLDILNERIGNIEHEKIIKYWIEDNL